MILWICPNGSMGLQIFVSADPVEGNAQAHDFSKMMLTSQDQR